MDNLTFTVIIRFKMSTRKSIGFVGQRIIDIPLEIKRKCKKMPLVNKLFITKMGVYPKAKHHYFHRPKGMAEAIILYCTDGEGWVQLHKIMVPLKTGEVFIIPPGIPHSYGSSMASPWTIYWFHLSGTACSETSMAVMGAGNSTGKPVYVGVQNETLSVFDRIESAFLKGYSVNNLMFANLCVPYLLASFILPYNLDVLTLNNAYASHSSKAILFMQQNLFRPANLTDIAKAVHLSVSFFSRSFKNETGYSPIEYFNHLKIQKACTLLHYSSGLRINEVAVQIGIDDALYFSRLFKKHIGLSPAQYRKSEQTLNV